MRFILAWALLYVSAFGQISVPAETAPYLPIVATVATDIPEGATMDGGWTVSDGVHTLPSGSALHVWAAPGVHQIEYKGFWLLLKDVTFTDGTGEVITITSYLGHGFVNESATFKVIGGVDPEPTPDPTPDEGLINADGLKILIVRESSQPLTAAQQAMLRSTVWMTRVGSGNWMVVDPDMTFRVPNIWKDAMDATVNFGVPRVIVSNRPKGGVVKALPANLSELSSLIDEWAGD